MSSENNFFDLPNSPSEFSIILSQANLKVIDFTALEFETIRRTIIEYIKTHFPDDFNDFSTDNGFIMLMELVSYVGSILALRSDILANESFLPTALSERAVIQHLKLVGEKIQAQTPASVPIVCSISAPLSADIRIPAGTKFTAASPDGGVLSYELFKSPTDFTSSIIIPKNKVGIVGFGIEGSFVNPFSVISTGASDQQININAPNVLESPVFVDIITTSNGSQITERWTQIDIIESAKPNDKVYELRFESNNFTVVFGSESYGTIPDSGKTISVTYRTGGGVRGRIATGTIDESRSFTPDLPLNAPVVVRFRNAQSSEGGTNKESVEHAKQRGPISAATHNSIVSGEDYNIKAMTYSHPVYGAVLKAAATLRTSINANQIEIYVLASGSAGEPVAPSLGLKTGLATYLSELNVFTDEVIILDGAIKSLSIELDVVISRNADPASTKQKVDDTINNFFAVENFNIGKGFKLSTLYSVIQNVDGVRYVRIINPADDIIESTEKVTAPSDMAVGYTELLTLNAKQVSYYLESSQARI